MFKKLLEREDEEIKKTSLEDHEISQNIISVVRKAAPLLERVPENMPEFTLHNANHSIHVIENMDRIIPRETLKQLNTIEISILIYAAYLHDIGMVSSSDERKQIVKTSEFKNLLIFNEEFYEQFEEAKNNADYETVSDIENKIFTDYLRMNHVERAHKIIEEYELDSEISWKDIPYYQWVRSVCESHELSVKDLYNTKYWPNDTVVLDKTVNIQYLAVIFRLADILDIDPERTPKHLFYYINPKDEISIKEWNKHLSITGFSITSEKIKIVADCKHPEQERTLRKFIKEIDKEIEDSYRLVSSYRDNLEEKYTLKLSEPVDPEIHSIGYEYRDFHFELDYRRVLDLLMGEGLYGDPIVALRELLQNSVDAVRYRESLEKREGNGYRPSIEVSLTNDELIVEDNGIGMDEKIFKNYFMKVGRSYYQSLDFRQKNVYVDPVSEFGIGILSVFMVASKFTVESKRKTFEDELSPSKPIYFEIPTAYDYFVKRQSKRSKPGTKITLCLKPNHPFSAETLMETISKIAPFIEYPIVIETSEKTIDFSSMPEALLQNFDENSKSKIYLTISFDENNKNILKDIKGSVNIVYGEEKKIVAQRGFLVENLDIFPKWVNIQAAINLSNKAKLKLTPDRRKAIQDERYTDLVSAIESEILENITNHLKEYRDSHSFEMYVEYINELLKKEVLLKGHYSPRLDPLNEGFMKFYFENVPLPCVSSDGKQIYKIINDFDSLPCIAVTGANDWENKIISLSTLEEISRLIGQIVDKEIPLLLYDYPSNHSFSYMMRKRFFDAPSLIYVTSDPGVVIRVYSDKLEKREHSMDMMGFTYVYNYDEDNSPLFVNSPELELQFDERINYNTKHPLISPFLDDLMPRNTLCKNVLDLLRDSIGDILNQFHAYIPASPSSFYDIEYSQNLNFMLIGILKRHPEILNEFSQAIEEFWDEAIESGAISSNESFPGFDERDLPWFWSYDNK